MGTRWVVGWDGSDESAPAVRWATRHSVDRDVDLVIVHAHRDPTASRLLEAVLGQRDDVAGAARAREEMTTALAAMGVEGDVEHRIIEGAPGRVLVDATLGASLLVVGRHGAGGWARVLGSVSRYCATHSPAPVVVVPADSPTRPIERIVVGFDGSEHAAAALRWAIAFAAPETTVRALVAIEVAPWLDEDIIRDRLGQELQVEERRLLDLLAAVDPEVRARPDVVVRGARPALARAAETADLVVLGAHGAGRLGHGAIGSVSTWMLDGSPIPVVVVPVPPEAA
jgi:nucleotide-binding universal stress UspA family protein